MIPTHKRATLVATLALATALATTSPAISQNVSVVRCSKLMDGVFRPVLIVQNGNSTEEYAIGDSGLTRSILFSERRVKAWLQQSLGLNASGASYGDCLDHSGSGTPALTPPPPPPPPPTESGCSCGPCYAA